MNIVSFQKTELIPSLEYELNFIPRVPLNNSSIKGFGSPAKNGGMVGGK